MVDRTDPLPVSHQCALLDLPRSTFYHVPQPVTEEELELMALIDRCHLEHPYYGSRRIRDWLGQAMTQNGRAFGNGQHGPFVHQDFFLAEFLLHGRHHAGNLGIPPTSSTLSISSWSKWMSSSTFRVRVSILSTVGAITSLN